MQLFFDSGATKCDCILLEDDGRFVRSVSEKGINASYMSNDEMAAIFARIRSQMADISRFHKLTFSGAGCGNEANALRVRNALLQHFQACEIEVISDLLGACRLLCPDGSGIVAILGTGASACYYEAGEIVKQAPSLGYILGDEGSGTHLGKLLIQKYLRDEMPAGIRGGFEEEFHLNRAAVIQRIYREQAPNLFFASFAKYLSENKSLGFYSEIIQTGFVHFFVQQINALKPLNCRELYLMGSVGYYFQNEIAKIGEDFGMELVRVSPSPLSLLAQN